MSIVRHLKYNLFVRGLYMLYSQYFGIKRSRFGYMAESVILTPPLNYSK